MITPASFLSIGVFPHPVFAQRTQPQPFVLPEDPVVFAHRALIQRKPGWLSCLRVRVFYLGGEPDRRLPAAILPGTPPLFAGMLAVWAVFPHPRLLPVQPVSLLAAATPMLTVFLNIIPYPAENDKRLSAMPGKKKEICRVLSCFGTIWKPFLSMHVPSACGQYCYCDKKEAAGTCNTTKWKSAA